MATTAETSNAELQELAKRHLWMHFSRMGAYADGAEVPIIVRGDGCYVFDQHGKRYLDGLSSLFCTNIGHGRADVAQAGADQAKELGFFTNWSYAHPRAIELAAKIAELAPGDLNRVFFTSGGSEAVESALKLARQYHKLRGNGDQVQGHRARDRLPRHDDGLPDRDRHPEPARAVRAAARRRLPRAQHQHLPAARGPRRRRAGRGDRAPHRVRGPEHGLGDHPGAGPERRRLLRAARGLLPARARDRRPLRRRSSSPTRSSARGAGSASGSAPSATTTSPTSSRRPRASPRPTRRWAR